MKNLGSDHIFFFNFGELHLDSVVNNSWRSWVTAHPNGLVTGTT